MVARRTATGRDGRRRPLDVSVPVVGGKSARRIPPADRRVVSVHVQGIFTSEMVAGRRPGGSRGDQRRHVVDRGVRSVFGTALLHVSARGGVVQLGKHRTRPQSGRSRRSLAGSPVASSYQLRASAGTFQLFALRSSCTGRKTR